MCITGLKKTLKSLECDSHIFTKLELDELYWFVERKAKTKTRENVYIMTMISSEPRQIQAFCVARDKCAWRIQEMFDSAPKAKKYCLDGYHGYLDVDCYGAEHIRNCRDKSYTHNVESINDDLRHYIPILRRRSRCFPRKLETLRAVLEVFADAYNRFGVAKMNFRRNRDKISRELPFSVLDFL